MARLIDADALKESIDEHVYLVNHGFNETEYGCTQYGIHQIIDEAQTIDAEPVRHGKWITEECLPGVAVCSICGHEIRGIGCQYTKYCDECGARMDAERKEE